jgi:hypothetical protein
MNVARRSDPGQVEDGGRRPRADVAPVAGADALAGGAPPSRSTLYPPHPALALILWGGAPPSAAVYCRGCVPTAIRALGFGLDLGLGLGLGASLSSLGYGVAIDNAMNEQSR